MVSNIGGGAPLSAGTESCLSPRFGSRLQARFFLDLGVLGRRWTDKTTQASRNIPRHRFVTKDKALMAICCHVGWSFDQIHGKKATFVVNHIKTFKKNIQLQKDLVLSFFLPFFLSLFHYFASVFVSLFSFFLCLFIHYSILHSFLPSSLPSSLLPSFLPTSLSFFRSFFSFIRSFFLSHASLHMTPSKSAHLAKKCMMNKAKKSLKEALPQLPQPQHASLVRISVGTLAFKKPQSQNNRCISNQNAECKSQVLLQVWQKNRQKITAKSNFLGVRAMILKLGGPSYGFQCQPLFPHMKPLTHHS